MCKYLTLHDYLLIVALQVDAVINRLKVTRKGVNAGLPDQPFQMNLPKR